MTRGVAAPHRKHRGRKNCTVHSNPSNISQWRIAMKNRICYHQIHRHIRKPLLLCLVFILRFVRNLIPTTFLYFIVMFQFPSSLKTFFFGKIIIISYTATVNIKNDTLKCRKYCPELEILLHS